LRGLLGEAETQRDDLRTRLDVTQAELHRLTKEHPFPEIDLRVPKISWGEEGRNMMVILPVTLTNRESEPISVQFRLGIIRPGQPTLWLARLHDATPSSVIQQIVHPPVGIAGKITETVELRFWVATDIAKEISDEVEVGGQTKLKLRPEALVLEIEDYVSGGRKEFPNAGADA
jgi:hypothetical protein